MRLSKISRGLIVAIFVTIIVFFGILDIKLIFQNPSENIAIRSLFPKFSYIATIFILTIIYVYIKDKLYKKKIKRNISFVYRYIYLLSIILISKLVIIRHTIENYSFAFIIVNLILTIIISLVVKRIVFNISKSDILSVITLIASTMYINVIENRTTFVLSMIIILINSLVILTLQFLIDELKQKGIKTKKYIMLSILMGVEMGISTILGINLVVWLLVLFLLLFITIDLDTTHVNFPKFIINSVSNNNRDRLYKIERININKIIISIIISAIVMIIVYSSLVVLFEKISVGNYISNLNNNDILNKNDVNLTFSKSNIITYTKSFLSLSKSYYFSLVVYILIIEMLSFFLRRRYDTKTTVIKIIFIGMYVMTCVLNLNILYLQPLFNILLIIIAVINTSSLYLNREERIKMLVA